MLLQYFFVDKDDLEIADHHTRKNRMRRREEVGVTQQ